MSNLNTSTPSMTGSTGNPGLDRVFRALDGFRIEVPSWGFANTGTRFGKFVQPAAATTIEEKFADAAEVNRLTGASPTVALHVLWDLPGGVADAHTEVLLGYDCPPVWGDRDGFDPSVRAKGIERAARNEVEGAGRSRPMTSISCDCHPSVKRHRNGFDG